MDSKFTIRSLKNTDYNKGYLNLLSQLTDTSVVSFDEFSQFVSNLTVQHQIFVIEDLSINKIVGTGTILIELKLIHGLGKVAHIEDIVTDNEYRCLGLGIKLIDKLVKIAEENKCYKVILDCKEHNVGFYNKCGFEEKGVQMAKYFV
jgi:glucosamine-phosphate N-acetyltransferase